VGDDDDLRGLIESALGGQGYDVGRVGSRPRSVRSRPCPMV